MKYSLTLLALAAAATAQKIGACDGKAQPCIDDAIAKSGVCEADDEACACENIDTIQSGATECVLQACGGASEALKVVEEVKEYCANLPEDGGDESTGGDDATPTEGGDEPEPTGDEGEQAQPSDGAGVGDEGGSEGGDYDDGNAGNGTAPEEPPQGGAGALAPVGALLVGLFALAL